jgi:hypothetical protein
MGAVKFEVKASFGVSLIDDNAFELAYVSLKDFFAVIATAKSSAKFSLHVSAVQIDNQIFSQPTQKLPNYKTFVSLYRSCTTFSVRGLSGICRVILAPMNLQRTDSRKKNSSTPSGSSSSSSQTSIAESEGSSLNRLLSALEAPALLGYCLFSVVAHVFYLHRDPF